MDLNLSQLQYVLFDWDNTLAETRTTLETVINWVLKEYGKPPLAQSNGHYDKDLSFRDNFPNIFGADCGAEAYRRYAELYKQLVGGLLSTFPCVHETLEFFHSRRIPMIVLTNKDRRLLDFEMPLLFPPHIFTRIIAGHEAPKDKPYPEQAWYALRGLLEPEDFSPEKVWIVGDSDMDSDCALQSGAKPIRIGRSIWDNGNGEDDRILHFDSFCAFLHKLKSSL